MAVVVEFQPKEPAAIEQQQNGDLVSDNGEIAVTFTKNDLGANAVDFNANGYSIRRTPREIKYVDLELGIEDVLYDADNTSDLSILRDYHAWYDRHWPSAEEYFTVEKGKLKHYFSLRGDQRPPIAFLEKPFLALAELLEFDPSLKVIADGAEQTGSFITDGGIEIIDSSGRSVFSLPPIVTWDQKGEATGGKFVITSLVPGRLEFAIAVDYSWLSEIDRAYPVMVDPTVVVSSAYDTSGNGSRKIVRLSNGWIVAATWSYSYRSGYPAIMFYVSKDNGQTFSLLTSVGDVNYYVRNDVGFAITSNGTKISVIYLWDTQNTGFSASARMYSFSFDAANAASSYFAGGANGSNGYAYIDISPSYGYGSGVSIVYDGAGALHAAWTSKNSTYANSFNIRYSKSTDGGVTWATPTQVTYTSGDNNSICLVVDSRNNPFIVEILGSGATSYSVAVYSPTLPAKNFTTSANWNNALIYSAGGNYAQGGICAAVDSNDGIHVTWHGRDSTDTASYNIRYSKSSDGGATWTAMTKLTSGNTYNQQRPSLTVDPATNNLYLIFDGVDIAISAYNNIRKIVCNSGVWGSVSTLTSNTTNHAQDAQTLWSKFNMNSSDAIRYIWKDAQAASVKYDSITLNTPPLAPTPTQHANFDATAAQTFTWTFNDTAGDTQSAYQLEIYDSTTNPATLVLSVPKTGTIASTYALAANTLTNGKTYQWRVLTYDAAGAASPFSAYSTFKCSAAPTVSVTAPGTVTSDNFTATGSYVQAQGVAQKSYQFRLWNATGTTIVQDSPEIIGSANAKTFAGLANNTTYEIEMIATSQDGVSSSSGKVSFSIAYTPPATPVVTAQNDAINARTIVSWTNPTPTGTQPAVSSNNVYRRKVGTTDWTLVATAALSPFYDYLCPAGNFEYGVTALSVAGSVSAYSTAEVLSLFSGQWIIDEANPSAPFVFVYNEQGADITIEEQRSDVVTFAEFAFERRGVTRYHTGTVSALLLKKDGDVMDRIDALDAMANADKTYILKLASGRNYRVSVSAPKYKVRFAGAVGDVQVSWKERGKV